VNQDIESQARLWGLVGGSLSIIGVRLAQNVTLQSIFSKNVTAEQKLTEELAKIDSQRKRTSDALIDAEEKRLQYKKLERRLNKQIREETDPDKLLLRESQRIANTRLLEDAINKQLELKQKAADLDIEYAEKAAGTRQAQLEDQMRMVAKQMALPLLAIRTVTLSSWDFNRSLMQANSALEARNDLYGSALQVQAKLGVDAKDMADVYAAMRNQGQLYFTSLGAAARTSQSFRDVLGDPRVHAELARNATVLARMHEALGVSVESGAELLGISHALGISFQQLGDTIATVADNTSVTAQQVADIARAIGRVAYGYGMRGADVAGTTQLIAALQDQLQILGVDARDVAVNLVTSLSDVSKLGGLGVMFGGGPGLAGEGPERVKAVLGNIGGFLTQFQNNRWVFPQMAQMFGLTADQAKALIESMPKLNQAEDALQQNRIRLEQRYKNQSEATNKAFLQFYNSLKALLVEALTPLIPLVQWLARQFDALREDVVSFKGWLSPTAKSLLALGIQGGFLLLTVTKLVQAFKILAEGGVLMKLVHFVATLIGFGGVAGVGKTVATAATGAAGAGAEQALSGPALAKTGLSLMRLLRLPSLGATLVELAGGIIPAILLGAVVAAALAVIAGVIYKVLQQKHKLEEQAEAQHRERLQWGPEWMARTTQRLNDALFAQGRHGPGAFTGFREQMERLFGGGEAGAVAKQIKLGYLDPKQGLLMEQQAENFLLIRQSTNEANLRNRRMSHQEQEALREENAQIIALLAELRGFAGQNTEVYAKMLRTIVNQEKTLKDAADEQAASHFGEFMNEWLNPRNVAMRTGSVPLVMAGMRTEWW